jgi:hypothetical protein
MVVYRYKLSFFLQIKMVGFRFAATHPTLAFTRVILNSFYENVPLIERIRLVQQFTSRKELIQSIINLIKQAFK